MKGWIGYETDKRQKYVRYNYRNKKVPVQIFQVKIHSLKNKPYIPLSKHMYPSSIVASPFS